MTVFLGVSRTLALLKSNPGDFNFWCIGGASKNAKAGDQILLYFPVAVSKSKSGIRQIYQITEVKKDLNRSICYNYGMSEVEIQLLLNLDKSVTIKEMKNDSLLKDWGAIKRNMQGVTFAIDIELWPTLRSMIVTGSPNANKKKKKSGMMPNINE